MLESVNNLPRIDLKQESSKKMKCLGVGRIFLLSLYQILTVYFEKQYHCVQTKQRIVHALLCPLVATRSGVEKSTLCCGICRHPSNLGIISIAHESFFWQA